MITLQDLLEEMGFERKPIDRELVQSTKINPRGEKPFIKNRYTSVYDVNEDEILKCWYPYGFEVQQIDQALLIYEYLEGIRKHSANIRKVITSIHPFGQIGYCQQRVYFPDGKPKKNQPESKEFLEAMKFSSMLEATKIGFFDLGTGRWWKATNHKNIGRLGDDQYVLMDLDAFSIPYHLRKFDVFMDLNVYPWGKQSLISEINKINDELMKMPKFYG